ncbi:MAG: TRAP transporter small permease subunit [Rhodospirillaceae bacterium]|nr:TRAP transporter small permease subunit [Rhodospirillaceae bacterium]MBT5459281.1 TRAP transporter small permease subunit [Rhodospirillaceae bacterium]
MQAFDKFLGQTVTALAWFACSLIPCMFLMITIDVSIRTLGMRPPLFTSSIVEYALLYLAMCSAPFLVRTRGHVVIEALVTVMPDAVRRVLAKIVYVVCMLASFLFAYLCWGIFIDYWNGGELDVRGIDMPYWLQFLPLPLCFGLIGLEFMLYLVGVRSYYSYDLGEVKDEL